MLGYVTDSLLPHLDPTVSNCYIHVSMVKAGAAATALVVFEQLRKGDSRDEKQNLAAMSRLHG